MAKNSSRSKGYRKTTEKTTGYTPREKKIMIIGFAVIAVAILCAAFLPDWIESFSLLKVEDGVVQGMEDNWLISNVGTSTKPKYRKIAEVDPPEGYALTKRDSLSSDENLTYAVYEPVESGIAQQLMAQAGSQEAETLSASYSSIASLYGGEYLYTSEVQQDTIDGKTIYTILVEYTMQTNTDTENPEYGYTQSAAAYIDSPLDGRCVLLTANNDGADESAFADRDAMLEFVRNWAATVRLED